ncbi:MAG: RNA 2',3'-cyclic phosphodiesterase [Candidatus Limnocylindrales bacterium]
MSGPGDDPGPQAARDRPPGRGGSDVPRLFVAVPIPEPVAARIGELVALVRDELGPPGQRVRWVQMSGLHVTIRFLGPTRAANVDAVAAAVERAARARSSFAVRVGGAGVFPEALRPRALWIGIREGAIELGVLSDAVTAELVAAGWTLEARPFRPHLTIARTDGVHIAAEAGERLVAAAADLDLGFVADRVVLYRSHLGHGPARYEELRSVPLS